MAPALGIEPSVSPLTDSKLGDPLSPLSSPDFRLLLQVAEKWPTLNGSLKLAILAIIDSAP
jgi:hypothetical protein